MQSSTAVPSVTSSASNSSSQRPGKPLRTPTCAGELCQTVWHCRPDCHRHHESQPAADHHLGSLLLIITLVVANFGALYLLGDKAELIALISNLIGVVIGALLNERNSVISFFFGGVSNDK